MASGAPRERRLRERRRRAGTWRLLGRELPLALTGGHAGVAPRCVSSPGPGAWVGEVSRRARLLGVRILARMPPRRQVRAARWEQF